MGHFDNKVALVTGGGSGIGRATALKLASEGATVVIGNRNEAAGRETVARIEESGGQAAFVRTDVTREEDIEALVRHATSTYGHLDVAFNNAGVEGKTALMAEDTDENYRQVFEVNVRGVWLCMKHEIASMLKHGGGAIVNTASVAGLVGFPQHGMYVASKHAVIGLTKTAAVEYGSQGIRINAVSPAAVETAMLDRFMGCQNDEERKQAMGFMSSLHPIGRVAQPHEVANTVAWLLSDEASFMLGQSVAVDGGFTTV